MEKINNLNQFQEQDARPLEQQSENGWDSLREVRFSGEERVDILKNVDVDKLLNVPEDFNPIRSPKYLSDEYSSPLRFSADSPSDPVEENPPLNSGAAGK